FFPRLVHLSSACRRRGCATVRDVAMYIRSRLGFRKRLLAFFAQVRRGDQDEEESRSDEHCERNWTRQEHGRIASRKQHRAAQVLLHHRPEDETEQQWRRLAFELDEQHAQGSEGGGLTNVEA